MDPNIHSAPFSYNEETVILYALGIGAGIQELSYVYEKNLQVFPTFAVIPAVKLLFEWVIPQLKLDLTTLLHGEHEIRFHHVIPPSGTLYTHTRIGNIYDRGEKGAFIHVHFETRNSDERLLFENHMLLIDTGGGNFGGETGPKTKPLQPIPRKTEDIRFEQTIPADQCALYRLSGDKNPLHIDPDFSLGAGLPRPIFHGLGTLGFTIRGILQNLNVTDHSRLKAVKCRFLHPVFPGDSLLTRGWDHHNGEYIFQTNNQDGKLVLATFTTLIDEAGFLECRP